jgi:single-strand DNA-binding protein
MNINRVVLTGNLTKDPDLRSNPTTNLSICKLRLAVNTRRRNNSTGESCGQYLRKGRPVAIDGRLEWSEFEVEGQKRQSVDIIADNVQFLGSRDDAGNGNGNSYSGGTRAESDIPADTSDFEAAPVGAGVSDDDIPF